ncbi:hypothetical protein NM688_g854 [Phlebia brevispora]|uniref:Uncharacterized protein n=1 Tax=Phlebia brevispora TaxID=194682 RepID=A0ACC1TDJ0_9APHY|nr:hypothetical protein NM688_g854 [Phlebia brevispora]
MAEKGFVVVSRKMRQDLLPDPNIFGSSNVKVYKVKPLIAYDGGPIGQAELSYKFKCSNRHGALLALNCRAEKETIGCLSLKEYAKRNHKSRHAYATRVGVDCGIDDLVRHESELHYQRTIRPSATVGFGFKITDSREMSVIHHSGLQNNANLLTSHAMTSLASNVSDPSSDPSTATPSAMAGDAERFNQTIFPEFYQAKYRSPFRFFKMKGSAGPDHLPNVDEGNDDDLSVEAGHEGSDDEIEVAEVPQPRTPKIRSPLDILLDCLLESTGAEVAIAGHNELNALLGSHWPHDLETFLAQTSPEVEVKEGVAMLIYGDQKRNSSLPPPTSIPALADIHQMGIVQVASVKGSFADDVCSSRTDYVQLSNGEKSRPTANSMLNFLQMTMQQWPVTDPNFPWKTGQHRSSTSSWTPGIFIISLKLHDSLLLHSISSFTLLEVAEKTMY